MGPGLLVGSALGFGAVALLAAGAPSLQLEVLALVPLGAAGVTFAAGVNSSLQLDAEPSMRGRVMALYSVVFLGSTPIGAPIAGWLSETFDPRAALLLTATAALAAGAGAWLAFARRGAFDRTDARAQDALEASGGSSPSVDASPGGRCHLRGGRPARAPAPRRIVRPSPSRSPGRPPRAARARARHLSGGGGGGCPAGIRSRPRPGVRTSLTGSNAEDGST